MRLRFEKALAVLLLMLSMAFLSNVVLAEEQTIDITYDVEDELLTIRVNGVMPDEIKDFSLNSMTILPIFSSLASEEILTTVEYETGFSLLISLEPEIAESIVDNTFSVTLHDDSTITGLIPDFSTRGLYDFCNPDFSANPDNYCFWSAAQITEFRVYNGNSSVATWATYGVTASRLMTEIGVTEYRILNAIKSDLKEWIGLLQETSIVKYISQAADGIVGSHYTFFSDTHRVNLSKFLAKFAPDGSNRMYKWKTRSWLFGLYTTKSAVIVDVTCKKGRCN
jgi:hypothetical protein